MKHVPHPLLFETSYDPAACDIGIVHLGFGAFHRAHQALYVDDYMDQTNDLRWGIAAVNLRAAESATFAGLKDAQPGYVVKSMSSSGGVNFRRVRSHVHFVDWTQSPKTAEALLGLPSVHMVTITVTESGYYLDEFGALNPEDPAIKAELSGTTPTTIYGYLTHALAFRKATNLGGISILCCDNIRQNGKMLRQNLLSYLKIQGASELANWVKSFVTFPCSMVDRITPRSTDMLKRDVELLFGTSTYLPVMAEDFLQWVVEDNFAADRPNLSDVGVTFTKNVDSYEEAKIRILNGGHTCLTYLGALAGHHTFDQAMADPLLFAHFEEYERKEVLPALTEALPFDKSLYLDQIIGRFKNPSIGDTVERICADGFLKFPIFIRPTLQGCLSQGILPRAGIRSIASWFVFCKHIKAKKLPIKYVEPYWDNICALLSDDQIEAFAGSVSLWGEIPQKHPEFTPALMSEIREMDMKWPV